MGWQWNVLPTGKETSYWHINRLAGRTHTHAHRGAQQKVIFVINLVSYFGRLDNANTLQQHTHTHTADTHTPHTYMHTQRANTHTHTHSARTSSASSIGQRERELSTTFACTLLLLLLLFLDIALYATPAPAAAPLPSSPPLLFSLLPFTRPLLLLLSHCLLSLQWRN